MTEKEYRVHFLKISISAATGDFDPLFEMLQPKDCAGEIFMRVFLGDITVVEEYVDQELGKFLIASAINFWMGARKYWKKEELERVEEHIRKCGFEIKK